MLVAERENFRKARADSSPDPSSAQAKCKYKLVSVLRKSISPENSFRKTESELKPRHTARILGGQNPKKKNVLSILEKIHPPRKTKEQGTFFLFWVAERSEAVAGLSWSVRFSLELSRAPRVRYITDFENRCELGTIKTLK